MRGGTNQIVVYHRQLRYHGRNCDVRGRVGANGSGANAAIAKERLAGLVERRRPTVQLVSYDIPRLSAGEHEELRR